MAAWPWQIRPRSRCQSTCHTRFTHTRHWSRIASSFRYKVTHVWIFTQNNYVTLTDTTKVTMPIDSSHLLTLDTSSASLACSVTKLRTSKYLPKMAAWPWQLWSRSRCQSTCRTRFTNTRHWSRVANSLR